MEKETLKNFLLYTTRENLRVEKFLFFIEHKITERKVKNVKIV